MRIEVTVDTHGQVTTDDLVEMCQEGELNTIWQPSGHPHFCFMGGARVGTNPLDVPRVADPSQSLTEVRRARA